MPVVSYNKEELLKLIGKEMSDEELEFKLAMFGVNPEKIDDDVSAEITPNRPDLLSVEGLARGMRYFLGLETRIQVPVVNPSNYIAEVDLKTKTIRPYAICAVVKGLDLHGSLINSIMQVQEKLHITHSRNRRVASIGIYDLDKIKFPIKYKVVDGSYRFTPLGSNEEMEINRIKEIHPKGREFASLVPGPDYVVWEDSTGRTLSWPPVVNSAQTAVTEDTKNILIDVTGTRFKPVFQALNILVYMLADRGGKIYSVNVNGKDYPDLSPQDFELDPKYANKLLGLKLNGGEITSYLRKMGIGAKEHEDRIYVKIPAYRVDVMHQIDLVEDIAIAYGYDKFKLDLPNISTIASESNETKIKRLLASLMTGLGFTEVVNYHLTSEDVIHKKVLRRSNVVRVKSSVNENYNILRDMILPQLLDVLSRNKHHQYPQRIFEMGRVCKLENKNPAEELHISGAIASKNSCYTDGKSTVEALFRYLEKPVNLDFREQTNPSFLDGRVASVRINGNAVGVVGEIHPQVLENFEIEMPVVGFEINLEFMNWKDW